MTGRRVTRVSGTAVPLPGRDLDTDRIIPARYVKSVPFERLGRHVFAEDRARAAAEGRLHPFDDPRYAGASLLLVEQNFGCGSSREHAVAALAGWGAGIEAVIGNSFSNIFDANALANGIACATLDEPALRHLFHEVGKTAGTRVVLDVEKGVVVIPGDGWSAPVRFTPGSRDRLVDGTWDPLDQLLAGSGRVTEVASRLPYHRWSLPPGPERPTRQEEEKNG